MTKEGTKKMNLDSVFVSVKGVAVEHFILFWLQGIGCFLVLFCPLMLDSKKWC